MRNAAAIAYLGISFVAFTAACRQHGQRKSTQERGDRGHGRFRHHHGGTGGM